jgi:3-phosphoshikimate 1-carboxyvinyltransferase
MPEPIRFRVPGSKSQTQRELVLSAIAEAESVLEEPLVCDDSRHLRAALSSLGAGFLERETRLRVIPGPLRAPRTPLWCGDGGTVLRFLAPLALLCEGELQLDGSARLRERPIEELLDALTSLGVEPRRLATGPLPIALRRARPPGRRISIDVSRSSQFASALLMVGPLLPEGIELELTGEPVSRPYLELTLEAMRARGARIDEGATTRLAVAPGGYQPRELRIEGDWSSAAFLHAAGFVSRRAVEVENVDPGSTQGDRVILELLEELGRPREHCLDLTRCPDLIAPLAAAAPFSLHPTELRGIAHARGKESDRPAVLARGLREAGIDAEESPSTLRILPLGGRPLRPARLDPRGDHRMAMAFALLSLREPAIEVDDPGCVSKSYPGFFEDLARLREVGGTR